MKRELEALKILKANAILFDDGTDFGASMLEAIIVLDKALTPPTADEVCKALGEYLGEKVEWYGDFFSNPEQTKAVCDIVDGELTFHVSLPPHLITLIGRFYQSLEEENEKLRNSDRS